MIGIVVTGHGHFASGLTSSVELIGGKPEHYHAVDFVQEDSTDDLEKKLEAAFASLKDCTDGILVFTDLVGGSPFKVSVELAMKLQEQYKIVVLSMMDLGPWRKPNGVSYIVTILPAFNSNIFSADSWAIPFNVFVPKYTILP